MWHPSFALGIGTESAKSLPRQKIEKSLRVDCLQCQKTDEKDIYLTHVMQNLPCLSGLWTERTMAGPVLPNTRRMSRDDVETSAEVN